MRLLHLHPEEIDLHNDLFRCDFRSPDADMMKQVVDGVWYYPLTAVQRTHDETPVLISGFRLFHAACIAQTAGDLLIPVVLHPGSPDDPATWELALSHIGIAEHTPHEIAAFLRMANRRGGIETERAMRIIPGLVHHELAAAIRSAARLSRGTLKRHQREAIDIRKSAEIAAFLPSERAWITCLTCRLTRMSLSRLRRCADLMRDLSLRESLSILEIARAVARDIRANQGVDDPACSRAATRAEDLLAELECRRSPERYRMTEQFETIVRSLTLPRQVTIRPPQNFEGHTVTLEAVLEGTPDLLRLCQALDPGLESWRMLFNLLGIDNP